MPSKKVSQFRGKALRTKDDTLLLEQDNQEKLMESEWADKVSSHSLTTLHKRKFRKKEV